MFIIRIKSFAKLKDVIPNLDVHDVDRALAFYVEQLGYEIDFRYERDPKNYAGARRNDVCLRMQWQSISGGAEHGSGTQQSETNASEPVLLGRLFISVGRRAAHLANRHFSFAWLAG